jgi:hypothetical protein
MGDVLKLQFSTLVNELENMIVQYIYNGARRERGAEKQKAYQVQLVLKQED